MNPYDIEKIEAETDKLLQAGQRKNALIFVGLMAGLAVCMYLIFLLVNLAGSAVSASLH